VNLNKSLVFVIVRCYFLKLFPINFVFSRGRAPPRYATVRRHAIK